MDIYFTLFCDNCVFYLYNFCKKCWIHTFCEGESIVVQNIYNTF
jgi:hypothetical protein